MKTAERAKGKWRGILIALGFDQKYLTGKHGPCPFCEGRDRFRWDNDKGNGTFYCSQCGAGDGFEMLARKHGWAFKDAAQKVDEIVGGVRVEPVRQRDEKRDRDRLRELWAASVPMQPDDMAGRYLASRGVMPGRVPDCLRFVRSCRAPDGGNYPAMLAMVSDADGNAVNIHRTFLGANGKADMDNARAMMPGPHPDGSAVRLYDPIDGRLGIAEGIETAIAAAKLFKVPVWAALNARALSVWTPPPGVAKVIVFGDCDHSFTGQAAAFTLANRLVIRHKVAVDVKIPDTLGMDWADGITEGLPKSIREAIPA